QHPDVRRAGMTVFIRSVIAANDGDVWFRFAVGQRDGGLNAKVPTCGKQPHEKTIGALDDSIMQAMVREKPDEPFLRSSKIFQYIIPLDASGRTPRSTHWH